MITTPFLYVYVTKANEETLGLMKYKLDGVLLSETYYL